jgi:hypothetical protein
MGHAVVKSVSPVWDLPLESAVAAAINVATQCQAARHNTVVNLASENASRTYHRMEPVVGKSASHVWDLRLENAVVVTTSALIQCLDVPHSTAANLALENASRMYHLMELVVVRSASPAWDLPLESAVAAATNVATQCLDVPPNMAANLALESASRMYHQMEPVEEKSASLVKDLPLESAVVSFTLRSLHDSN